MAHSPYVSSDWWGLGMTEPPKLRVFVSKHRQVIAFIHLGLRGRPFSIVDIRDGANVSTSSVTRTLKQLVNLRMLRHYCNRYAGRNYECSSQWSDDVMKNIEAFELAKILNL